MGGKDAVRCAFVRLGTELLHMGTIDHSMGDDCKVHGSMEATNGVTELNCIIDSVCQECEAQKFADQKEIAHISRLRSLNKKKMQVLQEGDSGGTMIEKKTGRVGSQSGTGTEGANQAADYSENRVEGLDQGRHDSNNDKRIGGHNHKERLRDCRKLNKM